MPHTRSAGKSFRRLVHLATLAWVMFPAAVMAEKETSCETCHSEIGVAHAESVHARADVTCVDCHGGDPTNSEATAMSHGYGFKPVPERLDIPHFCASCHADRSVMHQYGLSTHQFDDYQTSQHGIRWAQGDVDAAVCTDCHGLHGILPLDDPRSSVARANIPATCGRCHADPELVARHDLSPGVVSEYEESVHGRALLEGGSKVAATCTSCHGSHAALPPGLSDIPKVCAKCHRNVAEIVGEGPHQGVEGDIGESGCEVCHGHHAIQRPSTDLLNTVCIECHEAGSAGYQVSQELFGIIHKAEVDYAAGRIELSDLSERGIYVADLEARMEEAHTANIEAARVQHTLSRERVETKTVIVESIVMDVSQTAQHINDAEEMRRIFVGILWAFIVVTNLLLYWKKRRLFRQEHERHAASLAQDGERTNG